MRRKIRRCLVAIATVCATVNVYGACMEIHWQRCDRVEYVARVVRYDQNSHAITTSLLVRIDVLKILQRCGPCNEDVIHVSFFYAVKFLGAHRLQAWPSP